MNAYFRTLAIGVGVLCSSLTFAGIKPAAPEEPQQVQNATKLPSLTKPAAARKKRTQTPASKPHVPAVAVGDTAVYALTNLKTGKQSSYTSVVEEVTRDLIVVRNGGSTRNTYTRDWNFLERKRGADVEAMSMPAQAEFKFPLKVGETWDARYSTKTRGGDRSHQNQRRVTVEALEKVSVPAGTFETFRLRSQGHYSSRGKSKQWTGETTKIYWYAPSISRFVKSELEEKNSNGWHKLERRELASFAPGG